MAVWNELAPGGPKVFWPSIPAAAQPRRRRDVEPLATLALTVKFLLLVMCMFLYFPALTASF
jgi:hypothetical protein